MEQKKKRGRKAKIVTSDPVVQKDGIIIGEYSKSVWNNGELVSFDIDWNKLAEHMKKVS